MSFDRVTRNALSTMIGRVRELLRSDVMDQLRLLGFQADGSVLEQDQIAGLSETDRTAGRELHALLEHFVALESGSEATRRQAAYDRLVREIGFTTLNRLVALRMAEERDLIIQAVGRGFASDGFQIYERVAKDSLGNRSETYRAFLECVYDELSLDLPVLFDRMTPESRIFPSERCLHNVLTLLNDPSLERLWEEDETIGWIYQYYNDPRERKKMRKAAPQVPRNSRELAVRNQFFTPRYVVEFLTDNTLGRIWYEMCLGQTALIEQCQYLVKRRHPIWLGPNEQEPELFNVADVNDKDRSQNWAGRTNMWIRPNPAITNWHEIACYAATLDGYTYAEEQVTEEQEEKNQDGLSVVANIASRKYEEFNQTGKWSGTFEELRICLFFEQHRWSQIGVNPEDNSWIAIQALYQAINEAWDHEVDIIPYRAKKDPRDLKILDPACGSGHFLLYAFDLLEVIYQEAWYDNSSVSDITHTKLREDYADLDTLHRAVPGLILRHNLYGVDIDLRASQIAALALWLRAQRSYQQINLKPAVRPTITKSNIVCAEPMPGERDMLEEYLKKIDLRMQPLVRKIWEKMRFADEAGILLKIEKEIEETLTKARKEAFVDVDPLQVLLFQQGTQPSQRRMTFTTDEERTFWKEARKKLLSALSDYATHASNGHATQRRLFAEDTDRGFAFIDLCQNRFDIILMNPPFGGASNGFRRDLEARGEEGKDLAAAFISSALDMVARSGFIGSITTRTIYFLKGLAEWRRALVNSVHGVNLFLDLGFGVLDAAVETAAAVIQQSPQPRLGYFIDARGKHEEIDREGSHFLQQLPCYLTDSRKFERIPRYPFAYWATPEMVLSFTEYPSIGDRFQVRSGGNPRDDFRFIRHWVEVDSSNEKNDFVLYSKGGEFRTYHYDVHLMLQWKDNGRELKIHTADYRRKHGWSPDWRAYMNSYDDYFRPAITWPRRTSRLGFRFLPAGCVFGDKSPVIMAEDQNVCSLSSYLAILNTNAFASTLKLMVSSSELAQSFEVGIVRVCPLPELLPSDVETQVYECFMAMQALDSFDETSHEYIGFTGGLPFSETLTITWNKVLAFRTMKAQTVLNLQAHFEDLAIRLLGGSTNGLQLSSTDFYLGTFKEFVTGFLSQMVGCILGRWDLRVLLNPDLNVKRAGPFTKLPHCSPAMLQSPSGRLAKSANIVSEEWLVSRPDSATLTPEGSVQFPTIEDSEYPVHISWDGILVNDPDHPSDIIRRIREVLAVLWPSNDSTRAEDIEWEVCQILRINDLREYFLRPTGFFEEHLKRYTRSRRQAPIYWPLSTASGSYTLWIYYQQLTSDTLFTAINRYIEPKIAEIQRKITEFEERLTGINQRNAAQQREEMEEARKFLTELQDFRDELLRVTALPYHPDLSDGVIINAAPLHRLFRLPKKWAKDTKECWENLQHGEYDWAHMAYIIWPERIREKCLTDQSFAIAHGLEHLYVEPTGTEWKKLKRKPSVPIEDEEEND